MKVLDSLIALHFEWFTPAAMNVIASAAAEVSRSGDMAIRPKHLFLGFLSSAKGYSAKLVAEAGVRIEGLGFRPGEPLTDESTRQSEKKRPYRGTETRFAASSKRILQRATKMAKALKSYSVGTDHIMLYTAT